MAPYFRQNFVDRMVAHGELVQQDRKLEAVRDLFSRVRHSYASSRTMMSAGTGTQPSPIPPRIIIFHVVLFFC